MGGIRSVGFILQVCAQQDDSQGDQGRVHTAHPTYHSKYHDGGKGAAVWDPLVVHDVEGQEPRQRLQGRDDEDL